MTCWLCWTFSTNVPQPTLISLLFISFSPHMKVFHTACSTGWSLAVFCFLVLALHCTSLLSRSLLKHITTVQRKHLPRWRRERVCLHPQGYSPRLKLSSLAILRHLILKMQHLIGAAGWRGERGRGRGEGGWVRKCEIVVEREVVVWMQTDVWW